MIYASGKHHSLEAVAMGAGPCRMMCKLPIFPPFTLNQPTRHGAGIWLRNCVKSSLKIKPGSCGGASIIGYDIQYTVWTSFTRQVWTAGLTCLQQNRIMSNSKRPMTDSELTIAIDGRGLYRILCMYVSCEDRHLLLTLEAKQ